MKRCEKAIIKLDNMRQHEELEYQANIQHITFDKEYYSEKYKEVS